MAAKYLVMKSIRMGILKTRFFYNLQKLSTLKSNSKYSVPKVVLWDIDNVIVDLIAAITSIAYNLQFIYSAVAPRCYGPVVLSPSNISRRKT